MGLFATLRAAFAASTQSTDRGTGTGDPTGAYWCHDCSERVPARDVAGDDAPACPACGDAMELERSPGSTGCAC
jgi:hypothetical protein